MMGGLAAALGIVSAVAGRFAATTTCAISNTFVLTFFLLVFGNSTGVLGNNLGISKYYSNQLSQNIETCLNEKKQESIQSVLTACSWVLHEDNIGSAIENSRYESREFFVARGNAHKSLGDFKLAELDYQRAYESSFGYHPALRLRAEMLMRLGRLDEAYGLINKAIVIAKFDPFYLVIRGQILISKEEYKQAIVDLKAALNARKDLAFIHVVLGEAYLRNKQYKLAARHFESAISMGFRTGQIFGDLAFMLSTSDISVGSNLRNTIELADMFLKSTKNIGGVIRARATVIYSLAYAKTGRFDKAKDMLSRYESELVSILGADKSEIVTGLMAAYERQSTISCPSHKLCQTIVMLDERIYASDKRVQ